MTMAIIYPKKLSGTVKIPPSKSELHRAIICASLAKGSTTIYPIELSNDVLATVNAVKALGAQVDFVDGKLLINGNNTFKSISPIINCDESASTLRFLIPFAALSGKNITFLRSKGLSERPLDAYLEALPKQGVDVEFESGENFPVKIKGKLKPGKILIPGNISSQFISGLLMALPILGSDSEIILTSLLESSGYVDMTIDVMRKFSVDVRKTNNGFFIKGNQVYKPQNYEVEGDWSSAAFWILAGALGGNVELEGLNPNSRQPDKAILSVLTRFGAKVEFLGDKLKVFTGNLRATEIYSSQFPDLVPVLSVLAAKSLGMTKIWGASRLRFKESNRIDAIYNCLKNMSVNIEKTTDGLLISGYSSFKSTRISCFKDHRIVMAMAIAATVAEGRVIINDAQSIHKSYPEFFEDFEKLGGKVHVISLDQ